MVSFIVAGLVLLPLAAVLAAAAAVRTRLAEWDRRRALIQEDMTARAGALQRSAVRVRTRLVEVNRQAVAVRSAVGPDRAVAKLNSARRMG